MFYRNFFLDILKGMASEYVNKLETLSNERRAFKHNIRKYKLAQLGLMTNVGLYTQHILAE